MGNRVLVGNVRLNRCTEALPGRVGLGGGSGSWVVIIKLKAKLSSTGTGLANWNWLGNMLSVGGGLNLIRMGGGAKA